jgi:hypothetical protein
MILRLIKDQKVINYAIKIRFQQIKKIKIIIYKIYRSEIYKFI